MKIVETFVVNSGSVSSAALSVHISKRMETLNYVQGKERVSQQGTLCALFEVHWSASLVADKLP